MLHADLTEIVIKSFYRVYNALGYGFLEKVYENALAYELEKYGLHVKTQVNIKVFYEGREVGDYYADLFVNEIVIVELKAAESLRQEYAAQLINYCKATGIEVGLLLNFGKSPEVKRVLFPSRLP
ncbi:MAG: GxxExxY protein [Desulfuromonadales bacterium]|nr:GxxExxY protein [Desulfuromonadales bacterium]